MTNTSHGQVMTTSTRNAYCRPRVVKKRRGPRRRSWSGLVSKPALPPFRQLAAAPHLPRDKGMNPRMRTRALSALSVLLLFAALVQPASAQQKLPAPVGYVNDFAN